MEACLLKLAQKQAHAELAELWAKHALLKTEFYRCGDKIKTLEKFLNGIPKEYRETYNDRN